MCYPGPLDAQERALGAEIFAAGSRRADGCFRRQRIWDGSGVLGGAVACSYRGRAFPFLLDHRSRKTNQTTTAIQGPKTITPASIGMWLAKSEDISASRLSQSRIRQET